MPTKKKKYNARFPPARIKKIMQSDDEVGKVAQVVPIIISKSLEIFVEQLLESSAEVTKSRNARTLTTTHIKASIFNKPEFAFLRELAQSIPDVSANVDDDDDNHVNISGGSGVGTGGNALIIPTTSTNTTSFTSGSVEKISRPTNHRTLQPIRNYKRNTTSATATNSGNNVPKSRGRPRKRPLNDDNTFVPNRKSQRNIPLRNNHPTALHRSTSNKADNSETDNTTDYDDDDEDDDEETENDDVDDDDDNNGDVVGDEQANDFQIRDTSQPFTSSTITTTVVFNHAEDDDYDNI